MLYFDRIDFSEGIDVNKASATKECDIGHYFFLFEQITHLHIELSKNFS